ncbi:MULTISPECIES: hypothetical protein [unclassified Aeribacillus]
MKKSDVELDGFRAYLLEKGKREKRLRISTSYNQFSQVATI